MLIGIVTPVFDDWASLSKLIGALEALDLPEHVGISLIIVDDGSTEKIAIDYPLSTFRRIREIEIVGLACNLGHQRAIAVGLVEVCRDEKFDAVVIMDCDGEDRPTDIPRMLKEAERRPGYVVCARRERRPGLIALSFWYVCYKTIFRLLTGTWIDFGNFCLIPKVRLLTIVSNFSVWNHLAAALTRSRIPLVSLSSDRGIRYAGKSKMNFVSLVMHGFSAMAVYSDIVMLRLMIATLILSAATALAILGVVAVKFLTDLAIPGWASSLAGILTVILLQSAIFFAISVFSILNTRNLKVIVPLNDAPTFILFRRKIFPRSNIEENR